MEIISQLFLTGFLSFLIYSIKNKAEYTEINKAEYTKIIF
jgi:hypothetical protein